MSMKVSASKTVKTHESASPHQPNSPITKIPARLIAAIFSYADIRDIPSQKEVCKRFTEGFTFWAKAIKAVDLDCSLSVLDLATLFGSANQGYPSLKVLKISLNFFQFIARERMTAKQGQAMLGLERMLKGIHTHCPNVSHLAIQDDDHGYGAILVESFAKSLECLEIRDHSHANSAEMVSLCPKQTRFKAGIYENPSLEQVLKLPTLAAIEAENLTDAGLLDIAVAHQTKTIALAELSLKWRLPISPTSKGIGLLMACKELRHLSLQFSDTPASLDSSIGNGTMIALAYCLPKLESFSLEASEGSFDMKLIANGLAEKCPKLRLVLQERPLKGLLIHD